MANLTLRSVKGSPLTNTELDGNFDYFTGSHAITGSLIVSSSITSNGYTVVTSNQTGSFTVNTSSFVTTGSNVFNGNQTITGSVVATSFTGSLLGTSSQATTASYINPTFISASAAASGFGSGGGSSINTSSFATTGSNIFRGNQSTTGSVTIAGSFFQTSGSVELGTPDVFNNRNISYTISGPNEFASMRAGTLSSFSKPNYIQLNGSSNEIAIVSITGTIYLQAATSITISGSTFLQGLPTSEPANAGQLWLSGSTGVSSKFLCVRV